MSIYLIDCTFDWWMRWCRMGWLHVLHIINQGRIKRIASILLGYLHDSIWFESSHPFCLVSACYSQWDLVGKYTLCKGVHQCSYVAWVECQIWVSTWQQQQDLRDKTTIYPKLQSRQGFYTSQGPGYPCAKTHQVRYQNMRDIKNLWPRNKTVTVFFSSTATCGFMIVYHNYHN